MNPQSLTFIYAYPLDRERRSLFTEKNLPYPSMEDVKNAIQHFESLWQAIEAKHSVLAYLAELTKRTPQRNLECFVFGAGLGAMSTPFLLPIWNKQNQVWSDEKFIDLMIHELIHIYTATNNVRYFEHIKTAYAAEEPLCQNHILLYAILKQTYQDLFNNEPMDFSRDNLPSGYARAITLVKEIGYEAIIAEYRSLS
jgi:hypothetical protein